MLSDAQTSSIASNNRFYSGNALKLLLLFDAFLPFRFGLKCKRRVYERRLRLVLGKPPTVLQIEAANSCAYMATIANRLYRSRLLEALA